MSRGLITVVGAGFPGCSRGGRAAGAVSGQPDSGWATTLGVNESQQSVPLWLSCSQGLHFRAGGSLWTAGMVSFPAAGLSPWTRGPAAAGLSCSHSDGQFAARGWRVPEIGTALPFPAEL